VNSERGRVNPEQGRSNAKVGKSEEQEESTKFLPQRGGRDYTSRLGEEGRLGTREKYLPKLQTDDA